MESVLGCITIKIEPETLLPSSSALSDHNIGISDDNTQRNSENDSREEDRNPVFTPEFVSIKREPDLTDTELTKASTTEVQTITSWKRKKTNAQRCREYRERKKLQNTMVQNITAERSDECSETDQLPAKKPKTDAERRKKYYEAQKLKKQKSKKIPKTAKQRNKECYDRKKKFQALNTLNHHSDVEEEHEELKKELKRIRHCERQRAYYHRQKDLKKNEKKKKKVPKTNAERQREFRQRNAEKSYVDIVKSESTSTHVDTANWHSVPIKYEPECHNINVEVSIKEEPTDTEMPTFEQNCDYIVPDSAPQMQKPCNMFITDVSDKIFDLNSTIDGKYMCPICQKIFANKGNVGRHIIRAHTREQFECNVCFRKFTKQGHYQKHILSHSSEKRFKCEECDKRFRTSSNLEQHKRIHLTIKPFHCQTCTRQFAVKANLVKHQRSGRCKVPSLEPIVCNVCDKVFQKEFLLKSHLRRHTTERPYTCDKCKMSFKYKSTLIRHVQLHNNIKPYSCNICKKKFTHSGLIKPHMRKHTGEKPYACTICNKVFAHKHNMQRHTLRHAKEKNLVCGVCNKKFPKESRLIYHMRTHTKAKPFICGVCPKTFSHRQNIIRHYSRKHPNDKYDCTDTDASVAKDVWENVVLKKGLEIKVDIKQCVSSDDEILANIKTEEIIGK